MFVLPFDCFSSLVSQWLSAEDVGRLDSAISVVNLRAAFLRDLAGVGCTIPALARRNAAPGHLSFLEWAVGRSVRVSHLVLECKWWKAPNVGAAVLANCTSSVDVIADALSYEELAAFCAALRAISPQKLSIVGSVGSGGPVDHHDFFSALTGACPDLREFAFGHCHLSESQDEAKWKASTSGLRNLKSLSIAAPSGLLDHHLDWLLADCEGLVSFELKDTFRAEGSFAALRRHGSTLRRLLFRILRDSNTQRMISLVAACTGLEDFTCMSNSAGLLQWLPSTLRSLWIIGRPEVEEDEWTTVIGRLPLLHHLDISPEVWTDGMLKTVATHCPLLREFTSHSDLNEVNFSSFVSQCPLLDSIDTTQWSPQAGDLADLVETAQERLRELTFRWEEPLQPSDLLPLQCCGVLRSFNVTNTEWSASDVGRLLACPGLNVTCTTRQYKV